MIQVFQILVGAGFILGTARFYKLRSLAKSAGYTASIFANDEDPWPSINRMIENEESPERKAWLLGLKRQVQVCMIMTGLGFVGTILTISLM